MPALLNSPSNPSFPNLEFTSSPAARIEPSSATSSSTVSTRFPDWERSNSASCCLRTAAKTRHPFVASRRTVALPIPLEAPVTTTERLRRVLIAILSTQTLVCIRLIAFIVKKADMVKKADGSGARGNQSRNSKATKPRILEAAREAFATLGYERATVRTIAQMANIHPSMVMRYYTNNV